MVTNIKIWRLWCNQTGVQYFGTHLPLGGGRPPKPPPPWYISPASIPSVSPLPPFHHYHPIVANPLLRASFPLIVSRPIPIATIQISSKISLESPAPRYLMGNIFDRLIFRPTPMFHPYVVLLTSWLTLLQATTFTTIF